jgi:hypothetical protein
VLALERATDGHNSIHQWHLKTANREHLNVTQHSEEQIFKNKTGKKVKKKITIMKKCISFWIASLLPFFSQE